VRVIQEMKIRKENKLIEDYHEIMAERSEMGPIPEIPLGLYHSRDNVFFDQQSEKKKARLAILNIYY
jgi:hypothetical protein